MIRSVFLLLAGALTLLTLTLLPPAEQPVLTSASASVFADEPGPSDQELIRREAVASSHPAPPPTLQQVISDAFSPLGGAAVGWALQIAFCESTDNPNAVNTDSNAEGLFQFLPSTWAGTPYAGQSPFDPVANSRAAAWLLQTYGVSQWECRAG